MFNLMHLRYVPVQRFKRSIRDGGSEMSIGFIGAGKVATAFGRYLRLQGVHISGYFDRHEEKVVHACRGTHSRVCRNGAEVAAACEILLITTRDDQIQSVCQDLVQQQALTARHMVGHMSGAHASTILSEAARTGAAVFSLHPLQAFAQEEQSLADLPHTWFSLEGNDPRLKAIEKILEKTGNKFFRIRPEAKSLYHLSACIFSNYLVTLMSCGMEALAQSGIRPQDGLQAMLPLIRGTIDNTARLGPAKALTGPIARGDVTTVRRHLDSLEEAGLDRLKHFYAAMGLETLDLALKDVLKDSEMADAVRNILRQGHNSTPAG
jgi:predicted short-subunit dehydrogenase-like oxidoreductase (DUF2520 family)